MSGSDDGRGQLDNPEHRQGQGQRVGNGKRGDLPQQRLEPRAEQEKSEDEQDMIKPLWDDVLEAQLRVLQQCAPCPGLPDRAEFDGWTVFADAHSESRLAARGVKNAHLHGFEDTRGAQR